MIKTAADKRKRDKKDHAAISKLAEIYSVNGRAATALLLNKSERWVKRWASNLKLRVHFTRVKCEKCDRYVRVSS